MKRRHLKFAGTLKSIYLFLYLLFYSVDSLLKLFGVCSVDIAGLDLSVIHIIFV